MSSSSARRRFIERRRRASRICSPLCKKIFHYFDFDKKESITFRQFLIGCVHLRKQPLFKCACRTAFEKCSDPKVSEISRAELADVLRLSLLLPSDNGMVELLKTFDVHDDEKISRDGFVNCLTKFPFLTPLLAGPINGEVYIEIV